MVVTISREYGSGGRAVPRGLAEQLGYRLLDDDLPVVVAARLGTSPEVVERIEYRPSGFAERLLRSLSTAVPEAFAPTHHQIDDLQTATQREVERLIRDAADEGQVVIVGRIGNAILAGRAGLLRVFLYAPLEWRVERIREWLGYGEAEARSEIARVDGGRKAYARERYDIAFGRPRHYDLLIDVSRFGVDGAIALIASAVNAANPS